MPTPYDPPSSPVAVVTGGSRGIGGAAARRLAGMGYSVVINYIHDQPTADSVVDAILADHGAALAVRANVTDELDVERLFVETLEAFGGIDAVVHTVLGHIPPGPIAEVPTAEFDALYLLDTRATFLINREAARHLRRGGTIVNLTSSLINRGPIAGYGAATATRASTDVLTRALALEVADRDISVNAIELDTDTPCDPEGAADAVAYLVSGPAHGITGQVLRLDDPRHAAARRNGDASR